MRLAMKEIGQGDTVASVVVCLTPWGTPANSG